MPRKIILTILSLSVVSAIGITGYYLYLKNAESQLLSPTHPYTSLMSSNQAFLSGERSLKADDPQNALSEFEKALPFAENKAEEAQIKNRIAAAQAVSGDYASAILTSKAIAADSGYGSITRAYSVQYLGQIYYASPSTERANITKEIFKDAPYNKLASSTNASVSYRNLFEYASSLYPLALSELRSSYWYADAIYALKKKASLSASDKETIKKYLQIISQKVARADVDIARVQKSQGESAIVLPGAVLRKVLVNDRLIQASEAYANMMSPERTYEDALSYVRANSMTDTEAILQYSYAVYLAQRYAGDKSAEIAKLLGDFYASTRFMNTSRMTLFKAGKTSNVAAGQNIRLLAGIDTKFKAFLQASGWIL